MPVRIPTHKPRPATLQRLEARATDRARGSAHARGYTSAWARASRAYLRAHPLCVRCEGEGRLEAATVTDHVTPHGGDAGLFWNEDNWQPLCKHHHDQKTASEDGGFGARQWRGGSKT